MPCSYDFFLLGGDDMWFVVENLRAYLGELYISDIIHISYLSYSKHHTSILIAGYAMVAGSHEIAAAAAQQKGLYIGRRFFPPGQPVFNSGGAGAVLDRVALQVEL